MNPTFDRFLSIPTASNSILEQTMSRTLPQIPDPLPATLTNADDEKMQRPNCVQGVECGLWSVDCGVWTGARPAACCPAREEKNLNYPGLLLPGRRGQNLNLSTIGSEHLLCLY